jgi:hypothetical protein
MKASTFTKNFNLKNAFHFHYSIFYLLKKILNFISTKKNVFQVQKMTSLFQKKVPHILIFQFSKFNTDSAFIGLPGPTGQAGQRGNHNNLHIF